MSLIWSRMELEEELDLQSSDHPGMNDDDMRMGSRNSGDDGSAGSSTGDTQRSETGGGDVGTREGLTAAAAKVKRSIKID